jgi:hypothetical protein
MPILEFGTGLLYGYSNAANLPANPTPVRLLLQEVTIDFKADLKKLWTQDQFPISKARGKVDVMGKAKTVSFEPDPLNQLFFAQTEVAGMVVPIDQEAHTITNTGANVFSVTVTNTTTPFQDNGVYLSSGAFAGMLMLESPTNPPLAEMYFVNTTTGVYSFNATDNGSSVLISYTYTNATRGKTLTMSNQLMGYAPEFRADFWGTFRNKVFGIRLNSCVMGSFSVPTKLEDYWVSDISFDASVDSTNTLGYIFADTF